MAKHDARFDDLLMAIAQKSGGLPGMLNSIFSFLHRRTDLYVVDPSPRRPMGFKPGVAEALLVRSFRAFPYKAPDGQVISAAAAASATTGKAKEKVETGGKKASERSPVAKVVVTPPSPPSEPETGARRANAAVPRTDGSAATSRPDGAGAGAGAGAGGSRCATARVDDVGAAASAGCGGSKATLPAVRYTDEGKQVPIGNGGVGPGYTWTQTLGEITVYCNVPSGTRAKGICCDVKASRMKLGLKGQKPIIDGEFERKIKAAETIWVLEGNTIILTLVKMVETWYKSVVKGHPEIDATRVDSTRNVNDYDAETQAAIRKIMFDQRQQAQGLPTSEEMRVQAMMEAARTAPGAPSIE